MSFHHSNMWNRYTGQFHISGNRNIHMFDTRQYVVLFREKPETEFVHDKARIEIPKLHISDISK